MPSSDPDRSIWVQDFKLQQQWSVQKVSFAMMMSSGWLDFQIQSNMSVSLKKYRATYIYFILYHFDPPFVCSFSNFPLGLSIVELLNCYVQFVMIPLMWPHLALWSEAHYLRRWGEGGPSTNKDFYQASSQLKLPQSFTYISTFKSNPHGICF